MSSEEKLAEGYLATFLWLLTVILQLLLAEQLDLAVSYLAGLVVLVELPSSQASVASARHYLVRRQTKSLAPPSSFAVEFEAAFAATLTVALEAVSVAVARLAHRAIRRNGVHLRGAFAQFRYDP